MFRHSLLSTAPFSASFHEFVGSSVHARNGVLRRRGGDLRSRLRRGHFGGGAAVIVLLIVLGACVFAGGASPAAPCQHLPLPSLWKRSIRIHRGACVCCWVDVHPAAHAKDYVHVLLVVAPDSFLPFFSGWSFPWRGLHPALLSISEQRLALLQPPRAAQCWIFFAFVASTAPGSVVLFQAPSEYRDYQYRVLVSPPTYPCSFVPLPCLVHVYFV